MIRIPGVLFGAVALGLTMQACSPDAPSPLAPEPSDPNLTTGTEPAWSVTKTADPSWDRSGSYDWDVEKVVTPSSLVLNQGQSGVFYFTITATRTESGSFVDSYGMTGQICVTNNSGSASVNLQVVDRLYEVVDGVATEIASVVVDVSSNPELDDGESHCYPYSITLPAGFVPNPNATYKNRAYVFTTKTVDGVEKSVRVGETTVDGIVWPTSPTSGEQEDESATVVDALECPAGFTCTPEGANWTFGATGSQELSVMVTNVSAPCGSEFYVVNTATLTEGDSGTQRGPASASGLVHTQECAPPASFEGCTPGYWKQKQHFDSWVGYTQTQDYDAVFGVSLFDPDRTLLNALSSGGGGIDRLGRHSVAALLNTSNTGVEYGMTTAQVIEIVQQAVASGNYDWASDQFETMNERGCPLN